MMTLEVEKRNETVEALRGLAAVAVAWFHFTNGSSLLAEGYLKASGRYGWLGVEVFFVLSGFIIPLSMVRSGFRLERDLFRFLFKRIVRLDPPYLAAIGISVALTYASAALPGFRGDAPSFSAPQLLAHLAYLNAFIGYPWVNPVFWTLAIEFQFYICIALSLPLLFHERQAWRLSALALWSLAGFVFPLETLFAHYGCLFALGICTSWRALGLIDAPRHFVSVALLTALAAASIGGAPAVVGGIAAIVLGNVRSPRLRVFTLLGSLSYSLYLLHVPVGGRVLNFATRYASRFHESPILSLAVLSAALAVSLVAAALLNWAIEIPAQRLASRLRYGATPGIERGNAVLDSVAPIA